MIIRAKFWISILVVLFFVMLAVIAGKKDFFRGEPLYIAVAGPMGKSNGDAMIQGISMYIEKVNQEGGIAGKKSNCSNLTTRTKRRMLKNRH
jgi:ABC-type branched-subunit amino acid transport system substrate-binding protein